jgi:rhamnogalacturonyl hydrolase YesR
MLLSQSNPSSESSLPEPRMFYKAAERQARHMVSEVTRFQLNGSASAISHRYNPPTVWGDFVYMVPPFLAYYGAIEGNMKFLEEAVRQCQLYNDVLLTDILLANGSTCTGLWRHIVNQPEDIPRDVCCTDPDVWLSR